MYGIRGVDFESAYDPAWACVGHDRQFRVERGRSRVDTLIIRGPNAWSAEVPLGTLTGVFELGYGVRLCPGECREVVAERAGIFESVHGRARTVVAREC